MRNKSSILKGLINGNFEKNNCSFLTNEHVMTYVKTGICFSRSPFLGYPCQNVEGESRKGHRDEGGQ